MKLLDEDMKKAKGKYRELIEAGVEEKELIREVDVLGDRMLLERFRISMMRKFQLFGCDVYGEIWEIERMIENLKGRKRKRKMDQLTKGARRYMVVQLRNRGYRIGEIAEKLGISRRMVYVLLE